HLELLELGVDPSQVDGGAAVGDHLALLVLVGVEGHVAGDLRAGAGQDHQGIAGGEPCGAAADDAQPPEVAVLRGEVGAVHVDQSADRKSTRLNSSHDSISYAVYCLKKKKKKLK